jgi:hypothetical protein
MIAGMCISPSLVCEDCFHQSLLNIESTGLLGVTKKNYSIIVLVELGWRHAHMELDVLVSIDASEI